MGKKSRSKREKEILSGKPSGKEEPEKTEKRQDKKSEKKADKKKESLFSQYSINKLVLIEDIALAVLFFSVALVFSTKIQVHFTLPKLVALRICSFFIVLIWIYRIKIGEIKTVPKTVFFTGTGLGLWWIFSSFFALHVPTALNGVYGRYNALLNHEIYLLLFFIVASIPMDMKRVERILKIFIAAFVPVSIYAILQFHQLDFISWPVGRSASTIGNPVILAAVLGLALPFILTFFLRSLPRGASHWSIYCWGAIFLVFVYAAFSTLSRGPWWGMIFSTLVVLIVNVVNKNIDLKRLSIFAVIFAIFGLLVLASNFENMKRVTESVKLYMAKKTDFSLQTRFVYYKAALNGIKDHPVTGVGFESFRIVYPMYRPAEDNLYFKDVIPTMVHNGYLQTGLTNGLPALILYLSLIFFTISLQVRMYKSDNDKNKRFICTAFIAAIVGYLVQDLFGWLEIAIGPYFWIMLGLGVALSSAETQKANLDGWKKSTIYAFGVLFSLALIVLSFDAFNKLNADKLFWKSQTLSATKDWAQIDSNIKEGLEFAGNDFYYNDMAGLLYIKRLNETGEAEAYKKGLEIIEKSHKLNPFDVYVLIHRVDLDSIALRKGLISKPSEFVEQSINKLISMDKNNPTVYESIVKLKLGEKKYKEAIEYHKKAIALRPSDASFYLMEGEIYYAAGDILSSINSYKNVVSMTEKITPIPQEWARAKYGIAYCLFNKRDFDSALKEMQIVLERLPKDVHAYIIMGDAYGGMGNLEKAKESFATALKLDPNNQFAKRGYDQIDKVLAKHAPPGRFVTE